MVYGRAHESFLHLLSRARSIRYLPIRLNVLFKSHTVKCSHFHIPNCGGENDVGQKVPSKIYTEMS